jgi:DHA3 family macrolide efflux protein-like MFS transporter
MKSYFLSSQMRIFILVWLGQLVSVMGSFLTNFALGIWIYQKTQSVTLLSLVFLATTLPGSLISPLAGVLVDRWPRRWVMILSDLGSGFSTLAIAILLFFGNLEAWHICLTASASSIFSAFHNPAYTVATTVLVPKKYLERASGMVQLARAVAQLLSPLLAGLLLAAIQLRGIILIDFISFLCGIIPLLLVTFPESAKANDQSINTSNRHSIVAEMTSGLNYITTRAQLLALLIFFAISNFFVGLVEVLIRPLILSFASPVVLGNVTSFAGTGMLLGSLLISIRVTTKNLINIILGFHLLGGMCILAAGLRASVPLITIAAFLFFLGWPIINASTQVIFQKKVAIDFQGRVFALRQMLTNTSYPIAYITAGPLADKVFEPLMTSNSHLALKIGKIIGTGPGRGIGLMLIIIGSLAMLLTVLAYFYPRLRLIDNELPDVI